MAVPARVVELLTANRHPQRAHPPLSVLSPREPPPLHPDFSLPPATLQSSPLALLLSRLRPLFCPSSPPSPVKTRPHCFPPQLGPRGSLLHRCRPANLAIPRFTLRRNINTLWPRLPAPPTLPSVSNNPFPCPTTENLPAQSPRDVMSDNTPSPTSGPATKPSISPPSTAGTKRKRGAAGKYYAVKVGYQPGVYYEWKDCLAQVTGFKGAVCE